MQQDEDRGWESVWAKHVCWLRTVLRARLRNSLDADEVLQDVAVLVWRKRDQLKDQSRIEPWLYRIAISQVLMFWRKQKRGSANVELSQAIRKHDERVPDPAEWVCRDEAHQLVREAMKKLSAQDREILLLKHVELWTYQQISDRLGISYDKAIYRLSRARNHLRKKLSENEIES
jgi:RNA polymerase sigma-70 factor (ECF subfamily)